MRILISLVVIATIISYTCAVTIDNLKFTKSPDLSCIMSSYTGTKNQDIRISEDTGALGSFTLTKPTNQIKPTSIISANYIMPSGCFNNTELMQFFGYSSSNAGYGSMINHFNCKGEGETCETYKFDSPQRNVCIMVANVDGSDKLTWTTSSGGVTSDPTNWVKLSQGQFDPNGEMCDSMEEKKTATQVQVGCIGKKCSNPNYTIYRNAMPMDNITFCYTSYSASSDMVTYAVTKCDDLIPPTPPSGVVVAISGYAFVDTNKNGYYEIGVDQPVTNLLVTLINAVTGLPALDAFTMPVLPQRTDSNGYYIFQGLSINRYQVQFGFTPLQTATSVPSTTITTPKSNKMDNTKFTMKMTVGSGTTQPVEDGEINPASLTKRILRDVNGGIL